MRNSSVDDIKEFIIDHYQYFAVGVLFIVLIVVLFVFSASRKDGKDVLNAEELSESVGNGEEEGGTEALEVPDVKLEQNAYEDLNSFFATYYSAMSDGDIDTVASMWSNLDDEDRIRYQTKASFTEGYDNMSVYTKPGPVDNSYIAFVYYEIKFKNIDTTAPGLSTFFVCSGDNGYYIQDMNSIPQNQKDYITAIANQEDVQELLTDVDTLYTNNIQSDPTLEAFMKSLQIKTDEAVAQAKQNGDSSGSSGESSDGGLEAGESEVRVTTTDAVNIREQADKNSAKLGSAAKGDTFVRLAEEGEWSRIKYKDGEAYIKSEFLTTANTGGDDAPAAPATEGETGGATPASGTIVANEAVSIRSGPSTDNQKLGSAHRGDKFTVTGEENGWYQIDYNGSTAYIKGEYCTKN
ncbi:MAG: SH3 domain-containing protein [Lachnospiraceae bacterium]|nr:SH3 domain-containing protein [Lachnospiraceae bacterium]